RKGCMMIALDRVSCRDGKSLSCSSRGRFHLRSKADAARSRQLGPLADPGRLARMLPGAVEHGKGEWHQRRPAMSPMRLSRRDALRTLGGALLGGAVEAQVGLALAADAKPADPPIIDT